MKKILRVFVAIVLMCASWYGFFVITASELSWIRMVMFVQAVVWMILSYEWATDEKFIFAVTADDADWDSDTFDDEEI